MRYLSIFFALLFFFSVVEAKNPSLKEIKGMEAEIVRLINEERSKKQLHPLKTCKTLARYAREHSRNRSSGSIPLTADGHTGFDQRAEAIRKIRRYRSLGENVAYLLNIPNPLPFVVQAWMDSPGHCENILGDYNTTGVGIAFDAEGRCFFTQLFAKYL